MANMFNAALGAGTSSNPRTGGVMQDTLTGLNYNVGGSVDPRFQTAQGSSSGAWSSPGQGYQAPASDMNAAGAASDHISAQGHPAPLTTVLIVMDCVVALAIVCYLAAARLIAREQRPLSPHTESTVSPTH